LGSIVKKVSSLEAFKYASKYGIDKYKVLRSVVTEKGLEVHHIIEVRFLDSKFLGYINPKRDA
jgi:hypothetical protein